MKEEFWKLCGQEDIRVYITKYPVTINMDTIHAMANLHNVKLGYWNGDAIKTMWKRPFDLEGKQNAKDSFRMCTIANRCACLKHGRIYPCPPSAYIDIFNEYFGTKLEHTEKDYVDIYAAKSIDEVFDFMCHAAPFCRYCKPREMCFGIKWQPSKGDIEEWT